MAKHADRIEQPAASLIRGTVLRTVPDRGFGFIHATEEGYGGADYFFHYTDLENCTLQQLSPGCKVTFIPLTTGKGPRAEHVTYVGM